MSTDDPGVQGVTRAPGGSGVQGGQGVQGGHDIRDSHTGPRDHGSPWLLSDPSAAAAVLAAGGLVGLPTETVYGLAADAANPAAVARVFAAKGRPADHPLIVHLASAEDLDRWVAEVPAQVRALVAQHWPGPLTVVLPKQAWVPDAITGGQGTVALRVPDSGLARRTIAELGRLQGHPAAVVAPSANRFGQVSPTTAAHVLAGLGDRLTAADAVLDGGPCVVGVESTIVAAVGGELRVLRPGAVVLGEEAVPGAGAARPAGPAPGPAPVQGPGDASAPGHAAAWAPTPVIRAPGTLAAHYAPRAEVVLAEPLAGSLAELAAPGGPAATGLLAPATIPTPQGWHRLAAPVDDAAYAQDLYAALRAADGQGLERIVAVPPATGSLRAAVLDRLTRAATGSRR